MAKIISRNYWIVYNEKGEKEVKYLTWKEQALASLVTKFYWDREIQAKRYLRCIYCKENGISYEMEDAELYDDNGELLENEI